MFYNLSILSQIFQSIKSIFNGIKSIVEAVTRGFTTIIDFLIFIMRSIGDMFEMLSQCINFLSAFSIYIPPFMSIFYSIFILALCTRLLVELL